MKRRTFFKGLLLVGSAVLAAADKALATLPHIDRKRRTVQRIWFNGWLVYDGGWLHGFERVVYVLPSDAGVLIGADELPLHRFWNRIPQIEFRRQCDEKRQPITWIFRERSDAQVLEVEGLEDPITDWRLGRFIARLPEAVL